jgi:hypothetical protein
MAPLTSSWSPLEFMQRLAALVPRPRLHLIRFHGVLAPNAGLRAWIVPGLAEHTSERADERPTEFTAATARSCRFQCSDHFQSSRAENKPRRSAIGYDC